MNITFQTETWDEFKTDFLPLFYKYVAPETAPEGLVGKVDVQQIEELEKLNRLYILSGRTEIKRELVAWLVAYFSNHINFADLKASCIFEYYVIPVFRKKSIGSFLFKLAEENFKQNGINVIFNGSKLALKFDSFFLKQGYKAVETLYMKVLD